MDPFIGEVRLMGFGFAPVGWAKCDGTLLPISQNTALFALLSTQYGGDGIRTFALPDLRGRTPIHRGTAGGVVYPQGKMSGTESVTLGLSAMPPHTHTATGSTDNGNAQAPSATVLLANCNFGRNNDLPTYVLPTGLTQLHPSTIGTTGTGQGHDNMQPSCTLNFCIATTGIWPARPA
jgi:microcystin-dependent protein